MSAKISEVCKVTPPASSTNDMCLPLSFFDLIWLRAPPVEMLFFYETPETATIFSLSILPKLKNSLSLALENFLPLSGNLVWPHNSPNPFIRYKKGDGVLFTVTESDADFHHLSSNNNLRETEIFSPLVARLNKSDSQVPLLAVKVTLFPSKGFCIGATYHHSSFDGKSMMMFLKSWTSFSRHGVTGNLVPGSKLILERESVRERYSQLEKLYINQLLKQNEADPRSLATSEFENSPNRVRGTFQLYPLDIIKLKECVRKKLGNHERKHTSTFIVSYAYIIVCLAKSKELSKNKVTFSIVIDYSAQLELPNAGNYSGNSIGFIRGDVTIEEIMKADGIVSVAYAIYKTMKTLNGLDGAEKWLTYDRSNEGQGRKYSPIYLAGSAKFKMYDMDFGWGRPKKAITSSIDKTGAISLMEGRDGNGGVEIELDLKKDEMEKFASAFAKGLNKMKHIKAAL